MAVIQSFAVELPMGSVVSADDQVLTLSRPQAESLCKELQEALGTSSAGGAEEAAQAVLAAIQEGLAMVDGTDNSGSGPAMTPEQYLAAQQATADAPDPGVYQRHPGSGIGNG